jgi:DNA-binding NarL/FixJ family response regulator
MRRSEQSFEHVSSLSEPYSNTCHIFGNDYLSLCGRMGLPVNFPVMERNRPKIIIADNRPLVAEGCKKLLEAEYDVVATVGDGRALVHAASTLRPQLVVLEVVLPLLNGLDAGQQIKQMQPSVKLVYLTMSQDADMAAEAFRRGASAYLLKSCAASELTVAVREVLKGRSYLSPAIASDTVDFLLRQGKVLVEEGDRLTERQREAHKHRIMEVMSEDRATHRIAVALLAEDREHLTTLQSRLRATRIGWEVFSHVGFPISATEIVQLQDSHAEVLIIDIPTQNTQRAIQAIKLIRATTSQIAIFAYGEMTQPNIVACMRAGACEYVDRSAGRAALVEALTRFISRGGKGSKGGSGGPFGPGGSGNGPKGGDEARVAVYKPRAPQSDKVDPPVWKTKQTVS